MLKGTKSLRISINHKHLVPLAISSNRRFLRMKSTGVVLCLPEKHILLSIPKFAEVNFAFPYMLSVLDSKELLAKL